MAVLIELDCHWMIIFIISEYICYNYFYW